MLNPDDKIPNPAATHVSTNTHQSSTEHTTASNSAPTVRWTIHPNGKQPAYQGAAVIHPDGSIGKVVSGQASVTFGGKPAACIGDKVECPGHTGVIIAGAKSVSIGGKALAREGDKTSCGGVIMNGFPTITVQDLTKTVHGKTAEEKLREVKLTFFPSSDAEQGDYIGMSYKVTLENKEVGQGVIDEQSALYFAVSDSDKEGVIELGNGQKFQLNLVERSSDLDKLTAQGVPVFQETEQNVAQYQQLLKESKHDLSND